MCSRQRGARLLGGGGISLTKRRGHLADQCTGAGKTARPGERIRADDISFAVIFLYLSPFLLGLFYRRPGVEASCAPPALARIIRKKIRVAPESSRKI